MTTSVTLKVAAGCARAALRLKKPFLLVGAPGLGKTQIIESVAAANGYDLIVSHPGTQDPTDPKGLPWPDAKTGMAKFLPFGDLQRALNAKKPTLWFLDDFGQAPPAVQAAYMQLLLARRIGEHVLPDCVTFAAATNRKGDRSGVSGILEAVKSRFATIVHVHADLASWTAWALSAGISPKVIAFLRFQPQFLHDFTPASEIENYPCPRTWHNVSDAINAEVLDAETATPFLCGAVGPSAGQAFATFCAVYEDLPDVEQVFLAPESARIPTKLAALFALATALPYHVKKSTFPALVTYATRLVEAGKGEVSSMLLKQARLQCPDVTSTQAYIDLASGPLAELVS